MRRDEFPIIDSYVKKEINAVLDDIRSEIADMGILSSADIKTGKMIYEGLCRHDEVLEIIDKHIKAVEE